MEKCEYVHNISGWLAKCDFVKNNTNCHTSTGYINYVPFIYCNISEKWEQVARVVLYFLLLVMFFIATGVCAANYVCPNLTIISKKLR
jgi:hypothetical protein